MNKIISFPYLDNYNLPIKYFIKKTTKCDIYIPNIKKKEYLNNNICYPFKYNLDNYIDAIEHGANILVGSFIECRCGILNDYYKQILTTLGYKTIIIDITKNNKISLTKIYKELKKINNNLSIIKYSYYLIQTLLIIIIIDTLNNYRRINQATALKPNLFEINNQSFLQKISNNNLTILTIIKNYYKYKKIYKSISIKETNDKLRILLIGSPFTLINGETNYHLINSLLNSGVVVYQETDLTALLLNNKYHQIKFKKISKRYLKYELENTAMFSISSAIKYCNLGIDGIIHMKSNTCTAEITAIPILSQISTDYNVPIVYLNIDNKNNQKDIEQKLEAFYNNIKSKNKKKI